MRHAYKDNFPELYQFFGGYFYQGWSADYRWEGEIPNFRAVILHFKAINPPVTLNRIKNELALLLLENPNEKQLSEIVHDLGSNFYPPSDNKTYKDWIAEIAGILDESPTNSRILRELN